MTVITVNYIITYDIFNNNFINIWEDYVNTIINSLLGPISETNHSPDSERYPIDIDILNM